MSPTRNTCSQRENVTLSERDCLPEPLRGVRRDRGGGVVPKGDTEFESVAQKTTERHAACRRRLLRNLTGSLWLADDSLACSGAPNVRVATSGQKPRPTGVSTIRTTGECYRRWSGGLPVGTPAEHARRLVARMRGRLPVDVNTFISR